MDKWRLDEWNYQFAQNALRLMMMNQEEIREATTYLRNNNYPKPEDCPNEACPTYRPACKLEICQIAVGICGDF